MITGKTLDEALVELLRTKRALEALRTERKAIAEHEATPDKRCRQARHAGSDAQAGSIEGGAMNLQPPDLPEHGTCPSCGSSIDAEQRLGDSCTECPKNYLWGADPNCDHDVQCAPGGGVKCTKCPGWFCY